MSLTDATRVIGAVRATWGPAELKRVGPFAVPCDTTGGRRNCAARLDPIATSFDAGDVAGVEQTKPGAIFGTLDGVEDDLAEALVDAGYRSEGATMLMAGPVAAARAGLAPATGFAHWPPLAVTRDLWAEQGTGEDRIAVAARAADPKAAILLRHDNRPAGALFVACDGDLAVLHLVYTRPDCRRQGVGRLGLAHAAAFAARHGATHLALPVERDNTGAQALYRAAGMAEVGGYRYWRR